jgi:hypothetical protein
MKRIQEMVAEFHIEMGLPDRRHEGPQLAPIGERVRRFRHLESEMDELSDAINADDIVEIADACADIIYLAYGMAIIHGVDLDEVLAEVHRSNLTKTPTGGGSILKGVSFEKPDLVTVLDRQAPVEVAA